MKKFSCSFQATINGHQVRIDNYFNSYSSGFSHTSKLFIDGMEYSRAVCGYINRSWESCHYQSSSIKAVNVAIDNYLEVAKNCFKHENNIARMTKEAAANFNSQMSKSAFLSFLNKVKNMLSQSGCYCAPGFELNY